MSRAWKKAEGIFIPKGKGKGAKEVDKFRTISLLNEGKIFFALKADRLTDYCVANKYIDSSIQKGGFQGCLGAWRTQQYCHN